MLVTPSLFMWHGLSLNFFFTKPIARYVSLLPKCLSVMHLWCQDEPEGGAPHPGRWSCSRRSLWYRQKFVPWSSKLHLYISQCHLKKKPHYDQQCPWYIYCPLCKIYRLGGWGVNTDLEWKKREKRWAGLSVQKMLLSLDFHTQHNLEFNRKVWQFCG